MLCLMCDRDDVEDVEVALKWEDGVVCEACDEEFVEPWPGVAMSDLLGVDVKEVN